MKIHHSIAKDGPSEQTRRGCGKVDEPYTDGHDGDSARRKEDVLRSDHLHVQSLLHDWIIGEQIPFRQLESDRPRALSEYANPPCKARIPCHIRGEPHGRKHPRQVARCYYRVTVELDQDQPVRYSVDTGRSAGGTGRLRALRRQ